VQPPPSAPPQWSPDGMFWWNGSEWRPRSESMAPPAPPAFVMPPAVPVVPSPGLRIALIVVLSISALLFGLVSLAGVAAVSDGVYDSSDVFLLSFVGAVFVLSLLALVGVAFRARWSRWAALAAGVAVSLSCIGLVLGIPILVTAARAPDLSRAANTKQL
jgi:hypothetical protein